MLTANTYLILSSNYLQDNYCNFREREKMLTVIKQINNLKSKNNKEDDK